MKYENFTQMPVWKKAFDLMLKVYQITKRFPPDERFGLTSDMSATRDQDGEVPIQSLTILRKGLVGFIRKKKVTSIESPEEVRMNCGARFLPPERFPI